MNSKNLLRWVFALILVALLLTGCGGTTANPPIATNPPVATNPPAVAKPIASGEWVATTDFGKLVFTVDETGTKITKMSYQFSEWTCGPGTVSGTIEVGSEWPIIDSKFLVTTSLDSETTMSFSGTYDAANQQFSGTWDEVSHGTKCSGTWEASAPK